MSESQQPTLMELAQANACVKEMLENNYALSVAACHALIVNLDRRVTSTEKHVSQLHLVVDERLRHAGVKFLKLQLKVECLEAELMAISNREGGAS